MDDFATSIRAATPADVSGIRQCAELAYQHYVDRMQQTPAPMVADFEKLVAQQFVSVSLSDDTLTGFVVCYPEHHHLHLENVAVLPSHHGKGIGKQLIKHAEQQALSLGLIQVQLYTNELMHENLSMYIHLGYKETERKTQAGFNRVFFVKNLDEPST